MTDPQADAAAGREPGPAIRSDLPADAGAVLLPLARIAIADRLGLPIGAGLPDLTALWLQAPGASFVTLTQEGRLRGCIGTIDVHRPLVDDVRANAVGAAFRERRFPPLTALEVPHTDIEVSVLSEHEPLMVGDEDAAIAQLRPGVDGIVLLRGARRATFLPQVWQTLPEPLDFLGRLKIKAGLPPSFWDDDIQLLRYTVSSWSEEGMSSPPPIPVPAPRAPASPATPATAREPKGDMS